MRVESVLKALAYRFDTDQVKVDTTVANAARISKVYGTLAAKGDSTKDRPHRLARILEAPQELIAVDPYLLDALAALAPTAQQPVSGKTTSRATLWHPVH